MAHNDRRTGGKMPRMTEGCNGSILLIYFLHLLESRQDWIVYKATFCLVYLGRFSP